MRPLSTFAAAAACAASLTAPAIAQKVVPIGIKRVDHKSLPVHKRATFTQSLINNITGAGYYADVAVGTPPQNLSLILDTGSSDVWVLSKDADLCGSSIEQLKYGYCLATYESSDSSSYNEVSSNSFRIQYVDGTGAEGDYIKDDFYVGGAKITQLQMGLAITSTIPAGIMGIGFASNEATSDEYPNIMEVFTQEGLIGSKAYSLYLNDYDSSTGTILFGGIDTEKFIGQLTSIKLVDDADSGQITSFTIPLYDLLLSTNDSSQGIMTEPMPVVLDSGTTLTYLPTRAATTLYNRLNAKYDENSGLAYIDCKFLSQNISLDFRFGSGEGPTVSVPADEVIFDNLNDVEDSGYQIPQDLGFDNVCTFGIMPSSSNYLLGDTFLRSAYVVYDLQNLQIAIAQANLNSTKSNVIEISNSTTELPGATGVASQVSVTQTATGLPGVGSGAGGTGTAVPTFTVTAGGGTASPSSTGNAGVRNIPAPELGAVLIAALPALGMLAGGMMVIF